VFIHRLGYSETGTYGDALRQEIGLLYNMMRAAGPGYELPRAVIDKLFFDNAKRLMSNTKPPAVGPGEKETGMSSEEGRKVLRNTLVAQYNDGRKIVGEEAAPKLEEFLPADLLSGRRK